MYRTLYDLCQENIQTHMQIGVAKDSIISVRNSQISIHKQSDSIQQKRISNLNEQLRLSDRRIRQQKTKTVLGAIGGALLAIAATVIVK
jgi:hypothetical protein